MGKKTGPKPKVGTEEQAKVIGVLAAGGSVVDAAAIIGVNVATLRRFKASNEEFARGVKEAVINGKIRLIKRIAKSRDWKAAAWMLERKWGQEFGRREPLKVELGGPNGGPIQTKSEVTHAVDYNSIESELSAIGMARRITSDN